MVNCLKFAFFIRNLGLAAYLNGCFLALAHNCGKGVGCAVNFGFCKVLNG